MTGTSSKVRDRHSAANVPPCHSSHTHSHLSQQNCSWSDLHMRTSPARSCPSK